MPERLTDEKLQEIEARANAATPGPWKHTPGIALKDYVSSEDGELGFSLQSLHWKDGHETNSTNDAVFMAYARTDIPALLAEVSALREAAVKAKEFIEQVMTCNLMGTRPNVIDAAEVLRALKEAAGNLS